MGRRSLCMAVVLCLLGLTGANTATALNELTHEIINEQAARQSRPNKPQLDQILREELRFPEGIDEPLRGREVFEWLREGGIQEDSPLCRTVRHFHDPLQPWENAGLRTSNPFIVVPCGGSSFPSSVHWAQEPNQSIGEKASWQDARRDYLRALTALDLDARKQAFADTFRALGQQMHLVVDASVPEHVRNDPHLLESALRAVGLRGYGSYEHWLSDQHGTPGSSKEQNFITTYLSNPINFDTSILQQPTNDSKAPVPIAHLIDTDTYAGLASGPNVTKDNPAIGIAEFANANFFSDDTQPGHYPFPDINSLVPSEHPAPKTGRARAYYKKGSQDGVQVDPVLTECVLDEVALAEGIVDPFVYTCTDENVWAQAAQAMLPRVVSYAGGVLDYFFRGTLDFRVSPSSESQNLNVLSITNTSAEEMEGVFTLYADDFSDVRSPVAGASFNLNLGPGATSGTLNFTPPAEVGAYVLVFQGRLGLEEGAVAGKVNDWYAVTNVTPTTIAGGQATTLTVTVKSNFTRQARTLVAALFDGRTGKLAFTSALIPNNGPATTQIALDVTSTTISTDPTISPRPISLVVATAGDIGSITPADLNNQTPTGAMNLVRVGEASGLPIYQRPLTGRRMFVLSSRGGGISFVTQFDTRPFTVTWKFKNAIDVGVFVQPLNAHGEFLDGKIGELHFSGTQSEFSTFTISFAELGKKSNAMSVLFIEASLNDGFVCILDVVRDGESQLLSGDNHGGFSVRECPE